MTYGFSRDDIGKFIGHYKDKDILSFDPFQKIDREGVGELMRIAISKARQVKPTSLSVSVAKLAEILLQSPSSKTYKSPTFPALLTGSCC